MSSLGIIGAGNMGTALAKGLRKDDADRHILLYDVDGAKAEKAAAECSARTSTSAEELIKNSDITVIAVKPQQLDSFFSRLGEISADSSSSTGPTSGKSGDADGRTSGEKNFISIVAGVKISRFQKQLGSRQVIRFMPNLAATVSASVVGIAAPENVDEIFHGEAMAVAEALGTPVPLPEEQISSITGLSGSGIAYVFAFLHAMALGGTQAGIPYPTSLKIAKETVRGALEVLESRETTPGDMLTRVASAGGTTIEGIRALEEGGLTPTVMEAILRAKNRAVELEGK